MKRLLSLCLSLLLVAAVSMASDSTAVPAKNFGKALTLTEAVPIATLNSAPTDLVNKDVLVSGTIIGMCMRSGCWVELEAADSSRIICKSLDESVHVSRDCLGKQATVQGKLIFDPKAKGAEQKSHEGGAAHACPAPAVLVTMEGVSVDLAAVQPTLTAPTPETHTK